MKWERRLGPSLVSEAKSITVQPGAHEGQEWEVLFSTLFWLPDVGDRLTRNECSFFSDRIHGLEDGHRSFLESKLTFVSPKLKKNVNDYTLLATPSSLLPLESSQETSQHSSFLSPHRDAENRTDSQPMAVEAQLSQNGVWLLQSNKWQDVNRGKAGASSHVRTENFSLSAWSDSINCMDHTQSKMLPMWELSG